MAVDWLTRLDKKGFEELVREIVEKVVDKALQNRVKPHPVGIENRLAAIETRLDVADRLAMLKSSR